MKRTEAILWAVFTVTLLIGATGAFAFYRVFELPPTGLSGPHPPPTADADLVRLLRYGWLFEASLVAAAAAALVLIARAHHRSALPRGFPIDPVRPPVDPPTDPA